MLALHAGAHLEVHVIRPLALLSLLGLAVPVGADEMTALKPPLTKEQERDRFHPHREGMPPEPRLAGYERRLQMEKDSLLKGLRFALDTHREGARVERDRLTAIVSVADDGGSSGRLRRAYGVLPPGDIRNCIVALAEEAARSSASEFAPCPGGRRRRGGHLPQRPRHRAPGGQRTRRAA